MYEFLNLDYLKFKLKILKCIELEKNVDNNILKNSKQFSEVLSHV